ncbi:MAG: bifunctional methylenetetrahydrofolate dehydrogenase/methenyltetrahydrofolate cyclohydrolase FolD [Alphaproteobacteria bacterium]|nr:bifunctional methylenetetrahydrofolate dehydrogenase/methenyltetrahydrofolate cyclohydrolase FolD [Alphaproteobacteria bacterium]
MTATIMDGKHFAQDLRANIARGVATLSKHQNITPGLAVVLVGVDAASEIYVRNKGKMTREVGMESFEHKLPADTQEDTLLDLIDSLNVDPAVNGILVQLPLPAHIDEHKIINRISPAKDVDGFHVINTGKLATGQTDGMVPCTPLGCLMMAKHFGGNLSGKHAVVVGRSNIVGKPMAALLLGESCTVTIAHSRTQNLPELCKTADILVAAVGRPHMIKSDWIKEGAMVIDVGINRLPPANEGEKGKLVGDVAFDEVAVIAGHITPVPGGVGPMTIACLLYNTLKATCLQHGVELPIDIG